MPILRLLVRAWATSKRWSAPACSKTTRPAPAEAERTGKSLNSVSCLISLEAGSNENRLNSPLRSERKTIFPPTHIGSTSFERPPGWGSFSTPWSLALKIQIREKRPPR